MLLGKAAQLGIEIERVLLQIIEDIDDPGALIDAVENKAGDLDLVDRLHRRQKAERVGIRIDAHPDQIAGVRWAKNRSDQIRAFRQAPDKQGLSEITGLLLQSPLAGNFE